MDLLLLVFQSCLVLIPTVCIDFHVTRFSKRVPSPSRYMWLRRAVGSCGWMGVPDGRLLSVISFYRCLANSSFETAAHAQLVPRCDPYSVSEFLFYVYSWLANPYRFLPASGYAHRGMDMDTKRVYATTTTADYHSLAGWLLPPSRKNPASGSLSLLLYATKLLATFLSL
ncbi:hypothetical protein R3P38DRAFT_1024191 [Favolaschia claudopus]|uniref:Uncharacterized protein n=1 Tax=Favolaschia claudopus TaxID=2862362 RepID=A0AAW0BIG3_9AGAR